MALDSLGKHKEAILSHEKAIEIDPESANAYYNLACCYALQNNLEKSLEKLSQAINLDSQCREDAKTDTDFDQIRSDRRFQDLIG